MGFTREKGLADISLLVELNNEGVNIDADLFANLDYENTYLEQIRACFDWNFRTYTESKIPAGFRLKTTNFFMQLYWNPESRYSIIREGDLFYLKKGEKDIIEEVVFEKKPKFYNLKTSTGKDMSRIAQANSRGRVAITYSNECYLKNEGLDCLFCNINSTKDRFAEIEHLDWKTPAEIGEVVAAAFKEGFRGYNLTGGFIPERREVEYYLDVLDAVKEYSNLDEKDIHALACVGAPADLEIIEKYKEAGYQHIATNIEIWDENIFKTICPGKEKYCGGRANWVKTLKHEVEVFGRGNVRSVLVGGIEPKESLLEGIEILSEIGVIAVPNIWRPCIGSALEGHRAPTNEWFKEVLERTYQIHKKAGFTLEQFYYVDRTDSLLAYYYKLDGAHLPWEEPLDIV